MHGLVEISLDADKKINEFFVVIQGIAECEWTQIERVGSDRIYQYNGKEQLMNAKVTLFPKGTMPAGVNCFKFECILSKHLAASYEAKHGSIRYEIEAKLDIPWKLDINREFKRQFAVTRIEDLNLHYNAMLAVKNEEMKSFCCFPCSSDPCIITLTMPYSGYVPGQVLNYHLQYQNRSGVKIIKFLLVLRRITTYVSYHPNHHMKYEYDDLLQHDLSRLGVGVFSSYEGTLDIPHILVPSNTHCCRVVQVSYELKIEAVADGCFENITIHTPITIGSIPIRTFAERQAQHAENLALAKAQTFAKMPNPQNNEREPELPPTFEQFQKMTEKEENC